MTAGSMRVLPVPNFANDRLAHKERNVSIKNSRSALRAGAVTVGDSLNEEVPVKDDARSKFGHRLFGPASFLLDRLLGLLYEVVEFFF
jgi:hypothetical protein